MRLDHVDLIYAAPPAAGQSVADLVADVSGLITARKARAWGVLNWAPEVLSEAADAASALGVPAPCAAQLPYSVVRRSPVEDEAMRAALARAGAGVVASFCLEGGILSGKYVGGQAAGRAADALSQPRSASALVAAADLAGLAGRLKASPAALALAFPLASEAVASVLFGATSEEQLRANCAAAALLRRMSPATWPNSA